MTRFAKARLWIAAMTLACTVAVDSAHAQEGTAPDWANKNGAFGVGASSTLGGTNGLNLRYYVSNAFGLHLTFGFGLTSATDVPNTGSGKVEFSSSTVAASLYGSYKLAYWQRGSLSALLGGDALLSSSTVDGFGSKQEETATDYLLGLGLQGEWFPTQYLSLYASVGLRLDVLSEDDVFTNDATGSKTRVEDSGVELSFAGDLWGSAGFTVWFN